MSLSGKQILYRLFAMGQGPRFAGTTGIMLSLLRKFSNWDLAGPIRSFIFFVLFYLYLWLYVDLRLIYSGGGVITNFPVFFKGWAFFQTFTSYPGGPVEYLSAFLSQFFYIGWAGALVVTVQAWLICLCIDAIIKAMNSPGFRWLRFIPPILMLIIYTRYTYHFVTTMALLVALFFVYLYLRLTKVRSQKSESVLCSLSSVLCFLVLSVILFYIAAGAYLLFAVLCAIYELFFGGRRLWCLLYLLSAAVIPYVEGVLVFGVSIIDAFSDLLPFSWKIIAWKSREELIAIVYVLYLLLPSTALVLGFWRMWRQKARSKKRETKNSGGTPPCGNQTTLSPAFRLIIESFVLFTIAGAILFLSRSSEQKTLLSVHYYACRRMWPQVLGAAQRYPYSSFVINAVNRALYHTGQLGDQIFSYPQHPDALLLTAEDKILAYWHKFDTQIDLGLMNVAENNLTECMEVYGAHPAILERLALINMVKANYGSARIYLGALSKTLFHADWANNYLAHLQSDPNLSADVQIQHLRSLCLEQDHGSLFYAKEKVFTALLEKNRQNRMAFEYLMSWYMLTGQLEKFVQNIHRLDDFNFPVFPRLYEEAMLVYVHSTRKPIDLRGRPLRQQSRQRFEGFNQVLNDYGGNSQAAFDKLAENYWNSYFFYYVYGRPRTKK